MVKKIVKVLGIVLLIIIILVILVLGGFTVSEYRPKDVETVTIAGSSEQNPSLDETLKIISWNIGYGALGDNASFFLDGGDDVMTATEERVYENLNGISNFILNSKADIIMLQELDIDSKRSYHIDQSLLFATSYQTAYPGFEDEECTFAYNFNAYVPYPIPDMMGSVKAGLYTMTRFDIESADRISLPNPFTWPMRTVNLKRCLLVNRIPISGTDKELVIINLHLEAYDDGEGRLAQTKALFEVLEEEYSKGNYVIAGGDFNQTFSSVDLSKYPQQPERWVSGLLETDDFGDAWTFLMDENIPSCRSLDQPYKDTDKNGFQYYIIDGFIVSDNVDIRSMEAVQLDFVNSDHNPIVLEVTLKE